MTDLIDRRIGPGPDWRSSPASRCFGLELRGELITPAAMILELVKIIPGVLVGVAVVVRARGVNSDFRTLQFVQARRRALACRGTISICNRRHPAFAVGYPLTR